MSLFKEMRNSGEGSGEYFHLWREDVVRKPGCRWKWMDREKAVLDSAGVCSMAMLCCSQRWEGVLLLLLRAMFVWAAALFSRQKDGFSFFDAHPFHRAGAIQAASFFTFGRDFLFSSVEV